MQFEFWSEEKAEWITSLSVTTKAEADRLNQIIGRPFYIPKEAA